MKIARILVPSLFLLGLESSIISILIASFPVIKNDLLLSELELGYLSSSYYMFLLLGAIFWSYLYEKIPLFKIYFAGWVIWLIPLILIRSIHNYYTLIILFSLIGFGSDSSTIIIFNFLINVSEKNGSFRSSKALTLFYIVQGVGTILGTIIASYTEEHFGIQWSTIFFWVGVSSIPFVIFQYFDVKRHRIYSFDEYKIFNENLINLKIPFRTLREILLNRINLWLFLWLFLSLSFNFLINIWIQLYFIEVHGLSQTTASLSYAFILFSEFIGIIVVAKIVKKYVEESHIKERLGSLALYSNVIIFFSLGAALLLEWRYNGGADSGVVNIAWNLFISAISNVPMLISYLSLFVSFIFISGYGIIIPSILKEYNEKGHRSIVLNLHIIIKDLSLVVSPLLGGFIAEKFGFFYVMIIVPIMFGVSIPFFIRFKKLLKNGSEK